LVINANEYGVNTPKYLTLPAPMEFNTLASGCFWGFSDKKTPKCTWLCTGISPLLFGLRTWLKRQKMRQVF